MCLFGGSNGGCRLRCCDGGDGHCDDGLLNVLFLVGRCFFKNVIVVHPFVLVVNVIQKTLMGPQVCISFFFLLH
jgi:hypothetical protein